MLKANRNVSTFIDIAIKWLTLSQYLIRVGLCGNNVNFSNPSKQKSRRLKRKCFLLVLLLPLKHILGILCKSMQA